MTRHAPVVHKSVVSIGTKKYLLMLFIWVFWARDALCLCRVKCLAIYGVIRKYHCILVRRHLRCLLMRFCDFLVFIINGYFQRFSYQLLILRYSNSDIVKLILALFFISYFFLHPILYRLLLRNKNTAVTLIITKMYDNNILKIHLERIQNKEKVFFTC